MDGLVNYRVTIVFPDDRGTQTLDIDTSVGGYYATRDQGRYLEASPRRGKILVVPFETFESLMIEEVTPSGT